MSTVQGPLLIRLILTVVHMRIACGICKLMGVVIPCRAYWPLREAVRLGYSYVPLRSESSGRIAWNIPKGSRQLCTKKKSWDPKGFTGLLAFRDVSRNKYYMGLGLNCCCQNEGEVYIGTRFAIGILL